MNLVHPIPSNRNRSAARRLLAFFQSPVPEKLTVLKRVFYYLKSVLYYRRVFADFGNDSVLYKPLLLTNPRFMHIGSNVSIRQGVRMEAMATNPNRIPELRIGSNVNIEQNVHLICHSRLIIGNDVSITGHCAIVDVTHPYVNVHDPVKIGSRILDEESYVEIGDGSFLGFGSVVLPNVRIGKHCIVGALSVVTKDVPDFTVIAGNPAKALRRYDPASSRWQTPQ